MPKRKRTIVKRIAAATGLAVLAGAGAYAGYRSHKSSQATVARKKNMMAYKRRSYMMSRAGR